MCPPTVAKDSGEGTGEGLKRRSRISESAERDSKSCAHQVFCHIEDTQSKRPTDGAGAAPKDEPVQTEESERKRGRQTAVIVKTHLEN